ncbi:MAG: sigma-70 family RNA polymerase sigma factor [Bacteroidia bacterium]|nr:sigma-70 family RNA polymerase sigma factor [Bacteroidia bacterium]
MFFRKKKHIKERSDDELVQGYKDSGEAEYVGELFERYTHMVYLVCMKYLKDPMEAEDMSMVIFEKLMKDLPKYEVRNFKYWLHTVSKNQCLVFLDKQKRKRHKEDNYQDMQQGIVENGVEFDLIDEKEIQLSNLEEAITMLNEGQQECIKLFYLQKKSYVEVAEMTGYDLKKVKSYIQNGKRNLKKHLENMASSS